MNAFVMMTSTIEFNFEPLTGFRLGSTEAGYARLIGVGNQTAPSNLKGGGAREHPDAQGL
jgi:hypothetical protein